MTIRLILRWVFPLVAVLAFACASNEEPTDEETCEAPHLRCGETCVDPRSDAAHCGACSQACTDGDACEAGSCVSLCSPGLERCGDSCIDTDSDDRHCGGCNQSCDAGQACEGRRCVPLCEGETPLRCGDRCVDPGSDDRHCGACDHPCDEGWACEAGHCVPSCPAGETLCGASCVDTTSDREHCGDCGETCGDEEICVGGECKCPEGLSACQEGCLDLQSDDENCGECGISCGPDRHCVAGECRCTEGLTDCDGECRDTRGDAEHCGGCHQVCEGLPHATVGGCFESQCELSCELGYANCDGEWETGCEIQLDADVRNCGGCERDCTALARVVEVSCGAGQCVIDACEPGWGACSSPMAGCDTNLQDDPAHCGDCENDCSLLANVENAGCSEGSCTFGCVEGWKDCDGDPGNGCETAVEGDPENCGTCGHVCGVGEICSAGSCVDAEWAHWKLPDESPSDDDYDPGRVTVTDRITGLMWEREATVYGYYENAEEHCRDLALDGYDDWRLPTVIELLSIIDSSKNDPATNSTAFRFGSATVTSAWYWSASLDAAEMSHRWQVHFRRGDTRTVQLETNGSARCVRGAPQPVLPRYDIATDTVKDRTTGLIWQREAPASTFNWTGANNYCNDLDLDGHSDWRLPAKKELESLVDRRRSDPAIDGAAFPDTPAANFWTGTYVTGDNMAPMHAWQVRFATGVSAPEARMAPGQRVRCVRQE